VKTAVDSPTKGFGAKELAELDVSSLPLDLREGYAIHVLSYAAKSDAQALRTKLKNAGYPAFIETGTLQSKGRSYRVRVGKFVHEADALKVKAKLEKEESFSKLWILPK
jgi:cell division septation protein DedD